MKIYLVDLYEDHDVGEKFPFRNRCYSCRTNIDTEREVVVLTPDNHNISAYAKLADGGCGSCNTSWGLACQEHFAVIGEDETVIFSAKGYDRDKRFDPNCEFYTKFQEFMDNGWTLDSPVVLLSDEDDFIV